MVSSLTAPPFVDFAGALQDLALALRETALAVASHLLEHRVQLGFEMFVAFPTRRPADHDRPRWFFSINTQSRPRAKPVQIAQVRDEVPEADLALIVDESKRRARQMHRDRDVIGVARKKSEEISGHLIHNQKPYRNGQEP